SASRRAVGSGGSAWCLWSCLWAARAAAGLNGEWAPEEFGCASIVETTETMHDRKLLTLAELPRRGGPQSQPPAPGRRGGAQAAIAAVEDCPIAAPVASSALTAR